MSGVLKITPPTIFEDFRGTYVETYNESLYKNNGVMVNFIQDDISRSRKNVLRGIHGDSKSWKLVTCLYGDIYFVIVDNRETSETLFYDKVLSPVNLFLKNKLVSTSILS